MKGALPAVGPLIALGLLILRRRRYRPVTLSVAILVLAVIYSWWPMFPGHLPWLYRLQHVAVYGLLGWVFARSLAPTRVALRTHWPWTIHGPLSTRAVRDTPSVRRVWGILFTVLTSIQIVLFAFAKFGVFPLVAGLIVGQYFTGRREFPDMRRACFLDGLRPFPASPEGAAVVRHG